MWQLVVTTHLICCFVYLSSFVRVQHLQACGQRPALRSRVGKLAASSDGNMQVVDAGMWLCGSDMGSHETRK